MSSSDAPPPVERWVTWSARPKSASAAAESPPPTTVVPAASRDGLRDGARAGGEGLELERAHRPVPEDAAGAGDDLGVGRGGLRADVEAHPAVGHVDAVDRLHLGVGRERPAGDEVGGEMQLVAAAVEHAAGGLDALLLAQRRARRRGPGP